MKTIGLIGGMSWESSQIYYKIVNEKVKALKGGFSSCQCLLYSVDFAAIQDLQHKGDWVALDALMADAARRLHKGGADLIVLCTNTMHLCKDAIQSAVPIPFLHIADAAGAAVKNQGLKKVGLLGTKFTMEKDFYKKVLKDQHGIDTIIPDQNDRAEIHRIIYDELVKGVFAEESRQIYQRIITNLQQKGAEGVILGCTEIPLLIKKDDVAIPIFDTTTIHAEAAVHWVVR